MPAYKFKKGSREAKAYMAYLRSLRGRNIRGGGRGRGRTRKIRGGAGFDDLLKNVDAKQMKEIYDLTKGPLGTVLGDSLGYWRDWYRDNRDYNNETDRKIAEYERLIAEFNAMSPEEKAIARAQWKATGKKLKQNLAELKADQNILLRQLPNLGERIRDAQRKRPPTPDDLEDYPPEPEIPAPPPPDDEFMDDDYEDEVEIPPSAPPQVLPAPSGPSHAPTLEEELQREILRRKQNPHPPPQTPPAPSVDPLQQQLMEQMSRRRTALREDDEDYDDDDDWSDVEASGIIGDIGKAISKNRTARDILTGPVGWIAAGVRKGKERKLYKLIDEYHRLMEG